MHFNLTSVFFFFFLFQLDHILTFVILCLYLFTPASIGTAFRLSALMNPTGIKGQCQHFTVTQPHAVSSSPPLSPLLYPVCHYVVCASLCVLHWGCQRVSCWSLVWFQGRWPQSQFGSEGGYWHHKAYMGPQGPDRETVSGSLLSDGTDRQTVWAQIRNPS